MITGSQRVMVQVEPIDIDRCDDVADNAAALELDTKLRALAVLAISATA